MADERFGQDVLTEAAHRLNEIKEMVLERVGDERSAPALLAELRWNVGAVAEVAGDETQSVLDVVRERDAQIITAFVDGMLLGALACDVTWERSMGLVECP